MRETLPGKATLFVANQGNLDALSDHKVKALAKETETLAERNKALAAEIKAASAGACVLSHLRRRGMHRKGYIAHIYHMLTTENGITSRVTRHFLDSAELARIKSTPTDAELATQVDETESKVRPPILLLQSTHAYPNIPTMCAHTCIIITCITGHETPRTPRASARGHAARLHSRARHTRRRVDKVARRMGPAKKGVLQVRIHRFLPTPPSFLFLSLSPL